MWSESAQAWAREIEDAHRKALKLEEAVREAEKRVTRLKSEKHLRPAMAEYDALRAELEKTKAFIDTETEKFFFDNLGIQHGSLAAIRYPDGRYGTSVVVSMMRVRTLTSGAVIVSVSGDAVRGERGNQLDNLQLTVREGDRKELVAMT